MTNADAALLERIAVALERQVAQHDENVARNLAWRDENIARHNRERDAELEEARAVNARLIARLDEALALRGRRKDESA